jgi:hypothetical protein
MTSSHSLRREELSVLSFFSSVVVGSICEQQAAATVVRSKETKTNKKNPKQKE